MPYDPFISEALGMLARAVTEPVGHLGGWPLEPAFRKEGPHLSIMRHQSSNLAEHPWPWVWWIRTSLLTPATMVAYLYPYRLREDEPISTLIVRCTARLHDRKAAQILRNSSRTVMPPNHPTITWPTIDGHIDGLRG